MKLEFFTQMKVIYDNCSDRWLQSSVNVGDIVFTDHWFSEK